MYRQTHRSPAAQSGVLCCSNRGDHNVMTMIMLVMNLIGCSLNNQNCSLDDNWTMAKRTSMVCQCIHGCLPVQELFLQLVEVSCSHCGRPPKEGALCLQCGAFMCAGDPKCRNIKGGGHCKSHALACGISSTPSHTLALAPQNYLSLLHTHVTILLLCTKSDAAGVALWSSVAVDVIVTLAGAPAVGLVMGLIGSNAIVTLSCCCLAQIDMLLSWVTSSPMLATDTHHRRSTSCE